MRFGYVFSVSGSVHDIGDKAAAASGLKVGDSVCALVGGGGYAGETIGIHSMCSSWDEEQCYDC